MPDRYRKSNELLPRVERLIPLASQTFSKSRVQFPQGHAPMFMSHGKGGRIWDIDGNEYVDLICGLLPVILGYRDPDVDNAIRTQLDRGITFSMPSPLEYELAERLVEMIPCAEMVRFGKNGSDATAAAVRLARAYTGRDRIMALGYHGWQDWYIGATTRNKGIPEEVGRLTHKVPFNDLEAVRQLIGNHPDEFAGIILEPAGADEPAPGYLEGLKELARQSGTVLIFDEIITGFRVAPGGAQEYYGVTPDLATFGKAMGNGMPISAILGRAEIMREMTEIFFSGTFGGETLSIAAAIAVLDKLRCEPVIPSLWESARRLQRHFDACTKHHGLEGTLQIKGLPAWHVLGLSDHPNGSAAAIKTFFLREMLQQGVLVGGSLNVCYAHDDADLTHVEVAMDAAIGALAGELNKAGKSLDETIDIPLIRPVFQPRPAKTTVEQRP